MARQLSVGDSIIAHAAITKIVHAAAEDQPHDVDADAMARAILALAADVHYKPVTGALTVTWDLSGKDIQPTKDDG